MGSITTDDNGELLNGRAVADSGTDPWYHSGVNRKHERTLGLIFQNPPQANINWTDIEKLLVALGATITEGRGSRVRIKLGEARAVFHRPHPRKETDKGAVRSMRRFLESAGVRP